MDDNVRAVYAGTPATATRSFRSSCVTFAISGRFNGYTTADRLPDATSCFLTPGDHPSGRKLG